MSSIFNVEVKGGKMSNIHRSIFKENWGLLDDGWYKIKFEKETGYKHKTRYKYYFDCVLSLALPSASKVFQIVEKGKPRPLRNTKELHGICKALFNPTDIINTDTGEIVSKGATTTMLSDRDFIGTYLEEVMGYFATPPFNVEFFDYDEWKKYHNTGDWQKVKQAATTDI